MNKRYPLQRVEHEYTRIHSNTKKRTEHEVYTVLHTLLRKKGIYHVKIENRIVSPGIPDMVIFHTCPIFVELKTTWLFSQEQVQLFDWAVRNKHTHYYILYWDADNWIRLYYYSADDTTMVWFPLREKRGYSLQVSCASSIYAHSDDALFAVLERNKRSTMYHGAY